MVMERIGELIFTYRQQEKISLSEMAERTGVSKGSLSKIEAGETKRPSFVIWKKIASTINIPYSDAVGIYLGTTERPTTIKLLLEEAINLNNKTLVQKAAKKLLETPKLDSFLALDYLIQVTKDVKDRVVTLALYDVLIDYTRKRGIPYYLGKSLYERYLLERDDFSRFEETYRRGKELLHYIDFLQPSECIDYYYRMGIHAYILDYYGESIDFCSKGIRKDETGDSKQRASALIALVNSYVSLGDLILADYYLKLYEDSDYADFRKKHLRALLHARKGEYDQAIALYNECLREAEPDGLITIVSDFLDVCLDSAREELMKELTVYEDQFLPEDILIHPYRIKQAAGYFKSKGICQLSIGDTEEGLNSLLESMRYYRKIGAIDKVIECMGFFIKHHRQYNVSISHEHMEIFMGLCHIHK